MGDGAERSLRDALTPAEARAARIFVERVRREVRARLVQASLFGSKARGDHRPDSDVDLLLVFARLPPDREPQATHAERIAEEVAEETGIPVTTWSVSLVDLGEGRRTPMLVDALADGIVLWTGGPALPRPPFTPADGSRCAGALLDRVAEGSGEVRDRLGRGDRSGATLRARDDLVRMCTALMLLHGVTRPRRGEAASWVLRRLSRRLPPETIRLLRWAERSYGADGRDEESPTPPPPHGLAALARAVDALRGLVIAEMERTRAPPAGTAGRHPNCNSGER